MYSTADRVQQLVRLANVCEDIASEFAANRRHEALTFTSLSKRARKLAESEFDQADLNELSRSFPASTGLDEPKAIDAGLHREQWHVDLAPSISHANEIALELRVIGRAGEQATSTQT